MKSSDFKDLGPFAIFILGFSIGAVGIFSALLILTFISSDKLDFSTLWYVSATLYGGFVLASCAIHAADGHDLIEIEKTKTAGIWFVWFHWAHYPVFIILKAVVMAVAYALSIILFFLHRIWLCILIVAGEDEWYPPKTGWAWFNTLMEPVQDETASDIVDELEEEFDEIEKGLRKDDPPGGC